MKMLETFNLPLQKTPPNYIQKFLRMHTSKQSIWEILKVINKAWKGIWLKMKTIMTTLHNSTLIFFFLKLSRLSIWKRKELKLILSFSPRQLYKIIKESLLTWEILAFSESPYILQYQNMKSDAHGVVNPAWYIQS